MCGPRFGCDSSTRRLCLSLVQNYDDINQSLISDDQNDELAHLITNAQIDQHVLYLIVMLCSIFVVSFIPFAGSKCSQTSYQALRVETVSVYI